MAITPQLTRYRCADVTLLGDLRRPRGVTLAFTERTGGRSHGPYASLNLGSACGDDPASVEANRQAALGALGVAALSRRLVVPRQVHGREVLVVSSADDAAVAQARHDARSGVDAVVCTAPDVPVLLCFADCVPLVLVAPGGFAVVHSGWRGTIARIAAVALQELVSQVGCAPREVLAYVGPHIGADDYEVSAELAERFRAEFGDDVVPTDRHVDLGLAVRRTLVDAGVEEASLDDSCPSTASCTQRFFSFRAEGGTCGRHGALAVMCDGGGDERA